VGQLLYSRALQPYPNNRVPFVGNMIAIIVYDTTIQGWLLGSTGMIILM